MPPGLLPKYAYVYGLDAALAQVSEGDQRYNFPETDLTIIAKEDHRISIDGISPSWVSPCAVFSARPLRIDLAQSAALIPKDPFSKIQPLAEKHSGLVWSPTFGSCYRDATSLWLPRTLRNLSFKHFQGLVQNKTTILSLFGPVFLHPVTTHRILAHPNLFFNQEFFPVFVST